MEETEKACQLFLKEFNTQPDCISFAPGRIEFIGNHNDYNRGQVLGMAIREGISLAFKKRKDKAIHLISENQPSVKSHLDELNKLTGANSWANYLLGVIKIINDETEAINCGFDLAISSNLPIGAGLSSSAAVELAIATVLNHKFELNLKKFTLAMLCRKAENDFVGVPCGILDQGVSIYGKKEHLVKIDCSTDTFSLIPFSEDVHFWILNTNKKHSLIDSAYADRFSECQAAFKLIKEDYNYIDNLCQADFDMLDACREKLGDVLYRRALHVLAEYDRVNKIVEAIENKSLKSIGDLMFASHQSSIDNFENSTEELNFIVEKLKSKRDVYGARLTGGGFGGAVVALAKPELKPSELQELDQEYFNQFESHLSYLSTQSGEGARFSLRAPLEN